MKRIWIFDHYWNGLRLSFAIHIGFPDKNEDYYDNQYSVHMELFGWVLSLNSWKE